LDYEKIKDFLTAGRFFYELRIRDLEYHQISNLFYHGALDVSDYKIPKKNNNWLKIFIFSLIVIFIVSIIGMVLFCVCRHKKKRIVSTDENIREVMLEGIKEIKKEK
jgi:hypothetical protein